MAAGRLRESDNPLFIANKLAKKVFRKRIKQLAKEYDKEKVKKAVINAEIDKTSFRKMLKRERDGLCAMTPSIKDPTGKVVHDVHEILQVWKNHFASLGTPVESPNFEQDHYNMVNLKLEELKSLTDINEFSRNSMTLDEVCKGINSLNPGKAPGCDGIMKEHLMYASFNVVRVITLTFNWTLLTKFIPTNFRRGCRSRYTKGRILPHWR